MQKTWEKERKCHLQWHEVTEDERHTINGREVRQKEYDILQALRAKDNESEQRQVRFLRLWQKRKIKKLQVAEEDKIKLFLNFIDLQIK